MAVAVAVAVAVSVAVAVVVVSAFLAAFSRRLCNSNLAEHQKTVARRVEKLQKIPEMAPKTSWRDC